MQTIESECPLCGGRETWTGVTEIRDDQTYFEMHCEECGSKGFEWSREWEEEKAKESV